MRALLSPVIIVLVLAGFSLSYGDQDTPRINLKQLVQNQIEQIKARAVKQEGTLSGEKTASVNTQTDLNKAAGSGSINSNNTTSALNSGKTDEIKTSEKTGPKESERVYLKAGQKDAGFQDNGLFLKIFILLDLSLLAGLIVYWRRRKLKVGKAEKAKFKKNVTKLRSEAKFRRHPEVKKDEVRKNLQLDPVCDTADEALLRKHARKLSVPSGELMLASRLRSLEKAHE